MPHKYGKKAAEKVKRALHEFKRGVLRSGSGGKVTSRAQAVAIGLSQARRAGGKVPPPAPNPTTLKPMKPIDIVVWHSIQETDYGPHEEWRMEGSRSARIDQSHAMREAQKVVDDLAGAGIPAQILIKTSKRTYPKEW